MGVCWLLGFSEGKLICYEVVEKIMLKEKGGFLNRVFVWQIQKSFFFVDN